MQFRLSTLFLIFFTVAASLALFGMWGILVSILMLLAALSLNHTENLWWGIVYSIFIVFAGLICAGMLTPAIAHSPEAARRTACMYNLRLIGQALHKYHKANGHFPISYSVDRNSKPLLSWRTEILPMLDNKETLNSYSNLYNSLMKNEPWNSPENTKQLSKITIWEYFCPTAYRNEKDNFTSNYIALIGPGTAWNEDKPVKLSDLPDDGSHTVLLVEVVNSGIHWAEPRDLTVDEALENMKTGKGLRISSPHPNVVNVLFADGTVRSLPSKMPISLWKKLLAGEVKDLDQIEKYIDDSAPDMVDVSIAPAGQKIWIIILSTSIWLFSVVLLFRRAIKSRRKPVATT